MKLAFNQSTETIISESTNTIIPNKDLAIKDSSKILSNEGVGGMKPAI